MRGDGGVFEVALGRDVSGVVAGMCRGLII